jgi:hypothetical protein
MRSWYDDPFFVMHTESIFTRAIFYILGNAYIFRFLFEEKIEEGSFFFGRLNVESRTIASIDKVTPFSCAPSFRPAI